MKLKEAKKGNVQRKEIKKKRLSVSISMKSVPTCPVGGMPGVLWPWHTGGGSPQCPSGPASGHGGCGPIHSCGGDCWAL